MADKTLTKRQIAEREKATIEEMAVVAAAKARINADQGRVPGKVVDGTKTPWQRSDVEKAFPEKVRFVPDETIPVTYNGVRYQLIADVECLVPSCIKAIYDDYKRRKRAVGKSLASLGIDTMAGAGALEG